MKGILALCLFVSLVHGWAGWSIASSNGKLPESLIPTDYDLLMKPHIYDPDQPPTSFLGFVQIFFLCVQPTNHIVLNSKRLHISTESISVATESGLLLEILDIKVDSQNEFLVIEVAAALLNGTRYSVDISYRGDINPYDEGGLVWDRYQEGDVQKYFMWSDLNPHKSRAAFPCFDEPQYKAKFNVTLLRHHHMMSLSNAHLLNTESWGDTWVADHFAQTPEMSTYLMCFVICEFSHLEATTSSGTLVRVWSRPDLIDEAAFALSTAVSVQEWFEEYTGLPDPMHKMDHIALPNKRGAMENWGLIIYAEKALLWKEDWSDSGSKQSTALIIAHELAHMWFGNLVTMDWWDDIWLNEGFASYFESLPLHDVLGWDSSQLILERRMLPIQEYDISNTTSPVRPVIPSVWQDVEAFTVSQYSKGASVLRMISQVLTPETLQRGMQKYLAKFAFSTATSDDLWMTLSEQAALDGITDVDGSPLIMKDKFNPWLDQQGYPLIHVSWDPMFESINLTQSQFNPQGQEYQASVYNYKWNIPVTIGDHSSSAILPSGVDIWMDRQDLVVDGRGLEGDWIVLNIGAHTLCRVHYDQRTFNGIVEQLKTDHQAIHLESRVGLIGDSFNLAKHGILSMVDALKTTQYLASELEGLTWMHVNHHLLYPIMVLRRFSDTWQLFEQYLGGLTDPVYQYVEWEGPQGDIYFSFLRKLIIELACQLGNEDCVLGAKLRFQEWKIDPEAIAIDQRYAVLCYGIRQGTQTDWDQVFERYLELTSSNFPHEVKLSNVLRKALSCSNDTDVLDRYLQFVIGNMTPRDAPTGLYELFSSPEGRWVVWDHLKLNWRNETAVPSQWVFLHLVVEGFVTDDDVDKFEEFFLEYPPQNSYEEKLLTSAELIINKNRDWVATNQQPIHDWLEDVLYPE